MAKASKLPGRRSILWLCVWAVLILQAFFALRILGWTVTNPSSTTFMRAAQLRLLRTGDKVPWQRDWVPYEQISPWLKRAVVASEDATFLTNDGVDWTAIRDAWIRNQSWRSEHAHRVVGGSTITQQLAKNLFLSPQRSYLRKAQELVITYMLELILGKRRILEIYLNSVEWGDGIYGAEASAWHYFHVSASRLSRFQAARLAVMLPAPRLFEHQLYGRYMDVRTAIISARAYQVQIPR